MRKDDVEFWTPPANPVFKYSKEESNLFFKASEGFDKNAFKGVALSKVLKKSEHPHGRVPLGLLMLAGYGIKNAIIEVDTSLETFGKFRFCCYWRFGCLARLESAHI